MHVLPAHTETERLVLRHWTTDDAEALSEAIALSIEHLRPWMPWISHEPVALHDREVMIARWHEEWLDGGDSVYGVFKEDTIVGGAGLHKRVGPNALEIGYWIHVDHMRQGYATEAAQALTDLAFMVPTIQRVEIHHDKANRPSRGIPERLGYDLVEQIPDEIDAPAEIGMNCRWVIERATWASPTPDATL